jgi:hypothetical protein
MHQFLAVEADEVRGGFLEVHYQAALSGATVETINCQSPLSEGLVDSKYLLLPAQIFKHLLRRNPYVFVVGMGGLHNPLPRFLKAAGWSVEEVPFYFKVTRPGRFLRGMPMLRRSPLRRIAADIGAITGLGALAFRVIQRSTDVGGSRWSSESEAWGSWVTSHWDRFAAEIRFGVLRDEASIRRLYPTDREIGPLAIRRNGAITGWTTALLTRMQDSRHFGNLNVGTILDCVAAADSRTAAISQTANLLARLGADIVLTNHAHGSLQQACLQAGFRQGPSNYVLAASPRLVTAIGGSPVACGQIYLTRADGDGRINL